MIQPKSGGALQCKLGALDMEETMPSKTPETTLAKKPVTSEITENTEELIRLRAYQLYEQRGCEEGHAEEDWLQAESEILPQRAAKAVA